MSRDFRLSMGLDFKDNASRDMARTLRDTLKQTDNLTRGAQRQGQAQKKAATDAAQAGKQQADTQRRTDQESISAMRRQVEEYRRATKAREVLGIRSEQSIRREIDRTVASYQRLARAGTLSAAEQSRAWSAMSSRVASLRREMGELSRTERMFMRGRQASMLLGGLMAGASVLAEPVRKQMDYSESLTRMTNTAFGDKPTDERQVGMARLDHLVRENVQNSGLGKEDVLESLETLLASGMSEGDAEKILPVVTRYASSSGTPGVDLARLAVKAKATFGIQDEELPRALNMAVAAGQAGNFELRDMAKWLGPQLAAGANAGMSGLDDFGRILSLNELSAITAGSNDEAGNNVVNLLGKLTSSDAAHAAARVKINGKGIDLPGTLAQARQHNIDPIEAFSRVIDKVVSADPKYRKLQQHLSTVKKGDTEEMSRTLESMAKILEGAGVGKILVDRQALMAMLAYRNGSAYKGDLDRDIGAQLNLKPGEKGAGDLDFDFNSQQPWFQAQRFKNTRELSELDAMKPLADSAGRMGGWLADLGDKFPALATAVSGATTAIESMTAAALTFAGLKLLLSKTPGAGVAADKVMTEAGATTASAASTSGSWLSGLFKLGGAAMAVTTAATATTPEEDAAVDGSAERWKAIREKYPQELIDAARKKYQPWYQFGEGYSTENERWIQQYLQDMKAGGAQDTIPPRSNDIIKPDQVPGVAPHRDGTSAPVDAGTSTSRNRANVTDGTSASDLLHHLNVHAHFHIDGQEIAEKMVEIQGLDALRNTGGNF
ncbi:tail length tape measure protein [Salmonella enterica subsp. enterica serovar Mountpleasant]|nr:tail length tape measure protein [Salmonella enterica subsp. enterica serovar Mountpleasant]